MTRFAFFLLLALSLATQTSNADLIAYFPFEGNAVDASGNGHDGTITGATPTSNGFLGSAMEFDGVNDFVLVPLNH